MNRENVWCPVGVIYIYYSTSSSSITPQTDRRDRADPRRGRQLFDRRQVQLVDRCTRILCGTGEYAPPPSRSPLSPAFDGTTADPDTSGRVRHRMRLGPFVRLRWRQCRVTVAGSIQVSAPTEWRRFMLEKRYVTGDFSTKNGGLIFL